MDDVIIDFVQQRLVRGERRGTSGARREARDARGSDPSARGTGRSPHARRAPPCGYSFANAWASRIRSSSRRSRRSTFATECSTASTSPLRHVPCLRAPQQSAPSVLHVLRVASSAPSPCRVAAARRHPSRGWIRPGRRSGGCCVFPVFSTGRTSDGCSASGSCSSPFEGGSRVWRVGWCSRSSGTIRPAAVSSSRRPGVGCAQWFRNVQACPRAHARVGRREFAAEVVPLDERAAAEALQEYARAHRWAYRWFIGRLLLGHRPVGTPAEFAGLVRSVPVLLVRAAA